MEGEYENGLKNGKGKAYNDNDSLIFEGEYKNDERWNGKGKEYSFRKLIYDGEYKNGKKWNGMFYDKDKDITVELKEGKEFIHVPDENGKLINKQIYINTPKNGFQKEYDKHNNNLIF